MENLSHSRRPSKGLPSLPKKACNGNTFSSGKATAYDDVFGGPPRFGVPALAPRLEDYGEIFSGFNASRVSSIPVLDLPLVHEDEVFFDVRSSGFDYAEVFGGFDGLDLASSYEELVMDQSKSGGDGDSSEEAWTPVETESPLEESDHSGKSPCLSNGDSCDSIDASMEFSISYNKASQSEIGMLNGVTHVAESVPGYTFAVDKTIPLSKECENPCLKETADNIGRMMKGRHLRKTKTLSDSSNGGTGGQAFEIEDDFKKSKMYSRNGSFPHSMFVTVSEVNLRTQPSELPPPSRPPPLFDARTEDPSRFTSNSRTNATEGPAFASSPPFFDVEIDASSAAAVSAAAIKDAMEKAQAKIKSAKELMERKREGLQGHPKAGSRNSRKDKEGSVNKKVDGSCGIKEEIVHGVNAEVDNGTNFFAREERHKLMKATQEVPGSLEVEKTFNVVRKSSEEKPEEKSWSPQQLNEIDGNDEWKEATQFFELVRLDKSRASFEYENSEDILLHNTKFLNEHGQKEKWFTMGNLEKQPERKVKAVGENQIVEKLEKKSEIAKEACEQNDKHGKSGTSMEAHRHKKHEKKVKTVNDVHEEGKEKKSRMCPQPVGTEKKPTFIDQSEKYGNLVKVQQENKIFTEQAWKLKEKDLLLKEANESVENQKCAKGSHGREVSEKRQEEVFELKENERKLRKALEEKEFEKKIKEVLEQEEKEKRLKEVLEREEDEKKKKEAHEREENERRLHEARELVKNEEKLQQAFEQAEKERRQNEAHKYAEEQRRLKEALDHEKERKLKEALDYEKERKLKEALEQDEMEKRRLWACKREEEEQRLKEALQREENERMLKEAREQEETEKRLKMDHEEEVEKRRKEVHEKVVQEEEHQKEDVNRASKESQEGEESERGLKEAFEEEVTERTKEACTSEETEKQPIDTAESEELKVTNQEQQLTEKDENKKMDKEEEGTNVHREEEYVGVSDEAFNLDDYENFQTTQSATKQEKGSGKVEKFQMAFVEVDRKMLDALKDTDKKTQAVETADVVLDEEYVQSGMLHCNLDEESLSRNANVAELPFQEQRVKRAGESGNGTGQRNSEKIKGVSQLGSDMRNHDKKFAFEWEGRGNHIKQAQTVLNQEENRDKFNSNATMEESVEGGRKMEVTESSMPEGKGSTQKATEQFNDRNAGRNDRNLNEFSRSEEKENERINRERELENERLRQIEEEREREREREKDRMAVDRLNAKSRDRAERVAVERATNEARQRALAEARERLEKACAEAKEKSFGEKASAEARLRAERAAVERATAEARERAAEKAALEAKERMERSVSDKFSTSSRNRPSALTSDLLDHQFQATTSFGASRFPHSAYGASYYGEKSEGVEGESAQRCKARLERHRRTAERAAKALAEKNMRDLIAQREQAERTRLAETLDADVKRWSSGKEGNLRALLSTLQYILGPDSGWQPIPLTEVITAPAVKKFYRKATLCVHPDKLQQRGASIQQKYICEKVFDLLKEAWNKFNSEER